MKEFWNSIQFVFTAIEAGSAGFSAAATGS